MRRKLFTYTNFMKELLKESKKLREEWSKNRRCLHKNAETGFELENTLAFVKTRLEELGYAPKFCGKAGIIATVGEGENNFLLRADMDALPIRERSGEQFAAKNGNAHACGHDMHTAMLLGAAKLLKERENQLCGKVTLLFQAAEEILEGAKDIIDNGGLNPLPQAAMMIHVMTSVELPTGTAIVTSEGVSAPAADFFTIEIQGKGCHGSAPWNGVDALSVGAHILLGLQEISAREISVSTPAVLTVGSLQTGLAGNAISDFALLHGTLRAFDEDVRDRIKTRVEEVSKNIAKAFRAKAKVRYEGGCPTLVNDGELSAFTYNAAKELLGGGVFSSNELGGNTRRDSGGSEDFAYISHEVPSVMVAIAAGEKKEGYIYPLHHPNVRFDEDALPVGAALYACVAMQWLNSRTK